MKILAVDTYDNSSTISIIEEGSINVKYIVEGDTVDKAKKITRLVIGHMPDSIAFPHVGNYKPLKEACINSAKKYNVIIEESGLIIYPDSESNGDYEDEEISSFLNSLKALIREEVEELMSEKKQKSNDLIDILKAFGKI